MFSSCARREGSVVHTHTSNEAPNSPPFIFVWPLQSPQPGKYLPLLAWPGPVGGQKHLVLNVTAPASSGHVTP